MGVQVQVAWRVDTQGSSERMGAPEGPPAWGASLPSPCRTAGGEVGCCHNHNVVTPSGGPQPPRLPLKTAASASHPPPPPPSAPAHPPPSSPPSSPPQAPHLRFLHVHRRLAAADAVLHEHDGGQVANGEGAVAAHQVDAVVAHAADGDPLHIRLPRAGVRRRRRRQPAGRQLSEADGLGLGPTFLRLNAVLP